MTGLGQDLRSAARDLRRAPTFVATVISSLTLGIVAVAAAFVFIDAALFPSLPGVAEQDRIVEISLGPATFEDAEVFRAALSDFSVVSGSTPLRVALSARGEAHAVNGALVSSDYFDLLRVPMAVGRASTLDNKIPLHGVVIGHALWARVFGSDRSAVGEFVTIAGHPVQILGVAAQGFGGHSRHRDGTATELWVPAELAREVAPRGPGSPPNSLFSVTFLGRLAEDSTVRDAVQRAEAVAAQVATARASNNNRPVVRVRQLGVRSTSQMGVEIAAVLLVPSLVLLIGCINAANLMLVRGFQRSRDTVVRLALGASRWRVIRYQLVESLLLALLSLAAALPLLVWTVELLRAIVPLPLHVDGGVLVVAVIVAVSSVVVFGVAPAVYVSRARSHEVLRSWQGSNPDRPSRGRQALVVAQIALSMGLLATGGQLVSAVDGLAGVTGAQDPSKLIMVSFDAAQVRMTSEAAEQFYARVLARIQSLPGVDRAGLARPTALWTWGWTSGGRYPLVGWVPGAARQDPEVFLGGYVAGDLFEAIGLQLLQGRTFLPQDRSGPPRVAIVNRATADRYFNGTALARFVRVGAISAPGYEAAREVEIVGVIESPLEPDYSRTRDASVPAIYLPVPLEPEPALTLYLRARGTTGDLAAAVRQAAKDVDPQVPINAVSTLAERRYERQAEDRFMAQGLTTLGLIGLALACGGLYGMVSVIVLARRREIGVRMALGAEPSAILRMVLRQGVYIALSGVVAGGVAALGLSVVLRANMYGLPPVDVILFVLTGLSLIAATTAASLMPARRAARVDPLVALRYE